MLQLDGRQPEMEQLADWVSSLAHGHTVWAIGSVNRSTTTRLLDFLAEHHREDRIHLLSSGDLPLVVRLPQPDRVGVDRLLDAVAANVLRRPNRPAVVVDVGTAITVDLVDAEGVFRGGAILPGIGMSARAMHEFTDLLPRFELRDLGTPPPPIGTSTEQAIHSGLFWMAVGAIRELAGRMVDDPTTAPDIFISGGAGVAVADLLGDATQYVPHLTLSGIWRSVELERPSASASRR
jgi:type III pantothenate kinase